MLEGRAQRHPSVTTFQGVMRSSQPAMSLPDPRPQQLGDDPTRDQPTLTLPTFSVGGRDLSCWTLEKRLNLLAYYFSHKMVKVPSIAWGCSMISVE